MHAVTPRILELACSLTGDPVRARRWYGQASSFVQIRMRSPAFSFADLASCSAARNPELLNVDHPCLALSIFWIEETHAAACDMMTWSFPPLALLLASALVVGMEVVDPGSQPDLVDYELLQQFCRTQDILDQCPLGTQYCESAAVCPMNYACSCMQSCGNLACMLPPNVQVCTSHPPPRDGFTLNRANTVEFFCDDGFALSGPALKTCREGLWRPGNVFPLCKPSFCPELDALANGDIMFTPANEMRRFNTTATHSCDMGYSLVGARKLTCRADGTWSAPMPTCRRDGMWTEFSNWSRCDALCDRGLQSRNRTCVEPEEGGMPCPDLDSSEIRVCQTGKTCETSRLGCFTNPPWKPASPPLRVDFTHSQLDRVHRCLHRCRQHRTVYAAVHGLMNCWCFNDYQVDGLVPNCQSSAQLYEVFPVPQAMGCYRQVRNIVPEQIAATTYTRQTYKTKCGFFFWGRCTRYRTVPQRTTITRYREVIKTVKC